MIVDLQELTKEGTFGWPAKGEVRRGRIGALSRNYNLLISGVTSVPLKRLLYSSSVTIYNKIGFHRHLPLLRES